MATSWYATGHIQPLWDRFGEPGETYKREKFAEAVGTSPSVLSQINTGNRRLGEKLASRIAAVAGVSLLELGQPLGEADDQPSQTLRDRLEELEAQATRQAKAIRDLTRRLTTVEAKLGDAQPQPSTQPQARGGR